MLGGPIIGTFYTSTLKKKEKRECFENSGIQAVVGKIMDESGFMVVCSGVIEC